MRNKLPLRPCGQDWSQSLLGPSSVTDLLARTNAGNACQCISRHLYTYYPSVGEIAGREIIARHTCMYEFRMNVARRSLFAKCAQNVRMCREMSARISPKIRATFVLFAFFVYVVCIFRQRYARHSHIQCENYAQTAQ